MSLYHRLFLLCLCMFSMSLHAQQDHITIPVSLTDIENIYQFEENNKHWLLLLNNQDIQILQLDKAFVLEHSLTSPLLIKNKHFTSFTFDKENNPTSYWLTSNKKELTAFTHNLNNGTTSSAKNYNLNEKDVKVVAHFVQDNSFYIIQATKDSSILKILQFDSDLNIVSQSIANFSANTFYNKHNTPCTLYEALNEVIIGQESSQLISFDWNTPTTLVRASTKRKLYIKENMLYITLDNSDRRTSILTFNLKNKQSSYAIYNQDYDRTESVSFSSNSFLFDDKLIQACFSRGFINIVIRDKEGNTIKQYKITKNKDIDFITGDIYERIDHKLNRDKLKPIEKTNKFLRLTYESFAKGISAYPTAEGYIVNFGGVNTTAQQKKQLYGVAVGGVLSSLAVELIFSPGQNNIFNEYFNSSVYIASSALDYELNPIPTGTIPQNKIDEIRESNKYDIYNPKYKLLFKKGENYYLGSYEKDSSTLKIISL